MTDGFCYRCEAGSDERELTSLPAPDEDVAVCEMCKLELGGMDAVVADVVSGR